MDPGHPLEIIPSPFRRLAAPMRDYVRGLTKEGDTLVTVVLAEFIVGKWWHNLLHNGNGNDLKLALLPERDVVVTLVPYRLNADQPSTV